MAGSENQERVLRAKYLDWCSARVAERFLALTPDEIYQLAEESTHGQAAPGSVVSASSFSSQFNEADWRAAIDNAVTAVAAETAHASDERAPFLALVARVTVALADSLELPSFEEWSAAYQEAPGEFDPELIGFWREELNDEQ